MRDKTNFSWKKRLLSVKYAGQGFAALFKYEHNSRIHLAAAICAVAAGFFFGISAWEWCAVVMCIGLVISTEAMNSAVEAIADKVSPEYDALIGRAKDFGAAAVTAVAMAAVVVGLIIFIPRILSLFYETGS